MRRSRREVRSRWREMVNGEYDLALLATVLSMRPSTRGVIMASEIEGVRALLAGKPRPVGWAERRQRMDEICAIDPPAGDITFSAVEIGGHSGGMVAGAGLRSGHGAALSAWRRLLLGLDPQPSRHGRRDRPRCGRCARWRWASASRRSILSRRARRRFGRLPLPAGKRHPRGADRHRRRQCRRRAQPRHHAQPACRGRGSARPALAALALGGPGDDRRRAWRPRTPSIR